MSALAKSISKIDERLRLLQREIDLRRRMLRKRTQLTARDWDILRCLCALSNGSTTMAALYIRRRMCKTGVQEDELVQRLDEWHDNVPLVELNLWKAATGGVSGKRRWLREALQIKEEAELHHWVEMQNIGKGIAPHSRMVWARARLCGSLLDQSLGRKSQLQWVRRRRRRWRVSTGAIAPRERVPDETARRKAPQFGPGEGPILGPGGDQVAKSAAT